MMFLAFVIVSLVMKMELSKEEAVEMLIKWMGNKYFFEYAYQKSNEFRIYFGSLTDFEKHKIRKSHNGESAQYSNVLQIQEVVESPLFDVIFKKINKNI